MFTDVIRQYSWEEVTKSIYQKTQDDVLRTLNKEKLDLEDFKALISPAASGFLEQMANKSKFLTQKRFGKTMSFYLPVYLSNECLNHCTYCGFSYDNPIKRTTLTDEQILEEIKILYDKGFDNILLLTGESPRYVGVDYLLNAVNLCRPYFDLISLEVFPMSVEDYKKLIDAGVHSVYIYQETYNEARYKTYHPRGKKGNYTWRIETPDRLGIAGARKIGIGALIGLEEWRTEMFFAALHINYLRKTYWRSKNSLSFPRLRPAEGAYMPNHLMTDKEFAQTIFAFRIFDHDVEMSMSTRESPKMRDNFVQLGITSMSPGSRTEPGGYSHPDEELEQFSINDDRSQEEMEEMVKKQGYEVVYKDWDRIFDK